MEENVLLDSTLFIKTHAHSLVPSYRGESDGMPQHLNPDVISVFGVLEKACEGARVSLRRAIVNEVMAHLADF